MTKSHLLLACLLCFFTGSSISASPLRGKPVQASGNEGVEIVLPEPAPVEPDASQSADFRPQAAKLPISSFCNLNAEVTSTTDNPCAGDTLGQATIRILTGSRPVQTSLNGLATGTDTTFQNLPSGEYTVQLVDAMGCLLELDFRINAPDSLRILPVQTFTACYGSPTNEAAVRIRGGTGPAYQVLWDDPAQQTDTVATGLPAGPLMVQVTDEAGCRARANLQISNLDSISFNFLANPPTCAGGSDGGVGINQISGGAGTTAADYRFQWSNGATTIVQTNISGGITYSVTVSDQQGCSSVRARFLPDGQAISLASAQVSPPSCHSDNNGSIGFPALTSSNFRFSWGAAANNQTTNPATGLTAGSYQVTITDTALGCSTDTTLVLNAPAPLALNLTASNNPCFGYNQGSIQVSAQGGVPEYQYRWSTGSTEATISALPAGTYSLTLTDANNCSVSATATVTEPEGLTATAASTAVTCFGDTDGRVEITVEGGRPPFRYSLDGNTFTSSPTLIGLAAGNFTAYVEDANDCVYTTPVSVNSPPPLELDAGSDARIIFGDSVQLAPVVSGAQGLLTYQWFPPYAGILSCTDCPQPYASPGTTADYELVVTDENGCRDADFVRVFVDKPRFVAVPTGFTPNGDAVNSSLIVHGLPGTEILRFQVFDSWGELVFERSNFPVNDTTSADNWNGNYRGDAAAAGVYVWVLEARYADGSTELLRGQTTLIR